MLSGTVGYLALCAALLVPARHFAAHGRRGWALAYRLLPWGVIAGFAASATTVAAFTAAAGLGLLALTAATVRPAGPASTSAGRGHPPCPSTEPGPGPYRPFPPVALSAMTRR
ncbi:hypothetical protein AB0E27_11455 [Streptomyces sparsogenes]|uniref:hypothetical protein n=1 Tax=Streptomyces sparsogenes TaxID=67365 RepID=UPI0033C3297C